MEQHLVVEGPAPGLAQFEEAYRKLNPAYRLMYVMIGLVALETVFLMTQGALNGEWGLIMALMMVMMIVLTIQLSPRRMARITMKRITPGKAQGGGRIRLTFEADRMTEEDMPEGNVVHHAYAAMKKLILTPNLRIFMLHGNLMLVIPREAPSGKEADPVAEWLKQKCPGLKISDKR
jgi:hypothetical protein